VALDLLLRGGASPEKLPEVVIRAAFSCHARGIAGLAGRAWLSKC